MACELSPKRASVCNVCFTEAETTKCPKCNMGMCGDCKHVYLESCLEEMRIPVCINPECDFQFTISLLKNKQLEPKLLIATKKHIKMGDSVLTRVEIERKLQKIRQAIEERNKNLLDILPSSLHKVTLMVTKSSNQARISQAKHKLVKDSKAIAFRECPRVTCTGFVNLVTLKCSVCERFICEKCQESIDANHQCHQSDLDSLKFIKCDTQLCPKCRISINRSEGCSHMYCTNCKTHFREWSRIRSS